MGSLRPVAQIESVPCARSVGALATLGTFRDCGKKISRRYRVVKKKKKKAIDMIESLHNVFLSSFFTLAVVLADLLQLVTWPRHSPPFYGSLPFAMFPDISKLLVSPESYYFGLATPSSSVFCFNNKGCTCVKVAMVVVVPAREWNVHCAVSILRLI